ncbi:MAG: hypothetical protein JW828_02450 [Sedimentisphaerales bacterium]|nr:hypothetical protein [Sedimentisphaerales bacterium]
MFSSDFFDHIISKERATEILESHCSSLYKCFSESWKMWQETRKHLPSHGAKLTSTTTAGFIHDLMVDRAQREFVNRGDEICCYFQDRLFWIDFHGELLLRFKKLDDQLRPHNIITARQQTISQQVFKTENGSRWANDGATVANFGYRLNNTGNLRDLSIVCWYNNDLVWHIPIDSEAGIVTPVMVSTPDPASDEIIITPKKVKILKKV